MANVLDIRRRIRSVVNTRQITKAMKTVSAAKLRRAQEGALAARPYSQMLTNVLKSLVSRADVYDPVTGLPIHPLLAERPEKNILLIVVTGDKGLAGAFNTNILKMVSKFVQSKPDENVDVECIGRKGRDFMRRRYPLAPERASADGETGASPVQPGTPGSPPFFISAGDLCGMKAGGAGENRTHDRGFADLGLTTWLPRRKSRLKRKALAGAGLQETGAGDGI